MTTKLSKKQQKKLDDHDKEYVEEHDKNGIVMRQLLKHQKEIIYEDFGERPEEFEELDVRSEAWRAIVNLERIYGMNNLDNK